MKRKLLHLSAGLCGLALFQNAAAQTKPSADANGVHATTASSFIKQKTFTRQLERPHLAALRQQLNLSPHLELQWRPSATAADTFSVTDNFNRTDIGPDWALDSQYWAIKDGELVLTSAAIYEWRYLAVFLPIFNDGEREIYSVAYNWGRRADSVSIGEGAFALMIDAPSHQGSGYWLWRRTNQKSVWLYAIKNGAWEYTPGESKEFHRVDAHRPIPQAGDRIAAIIRNEPQAVYFDYYINDYRDGTVYDASREFAQTNPWYAGVFIHGQDLNNQVDNFTVTWLDGEDNVAPAAVTDLRALDSSATSVTLAWTSPGDNFWDGYADHFEIRYDTQLITEDNFSSAKLATNLPQPEAGGVEQQMTITGLRKDEKYYFALRAFDEAKNESALSNIAQAFTKETSVATALELVSGCDQSGAAGEALPLPIIVRVNDQANAPFANYPVKFSIKSGEALFVNGEADFNAVTDSEGRASAELELGKVAGAITLEMSATGLSNSPIVCKATARAGAATVFVQVSGEPQLLSAGVKAAPLVLRVTDQYGNSVGNHPLIFKIVDGEGKFVSGGDSHATLTAANGTASAEVVASEVAGDTTIVAVEQARFFIFTAAAESLLAVSGNNQTAQVKMQLPKPLVVRVRDMLGAPVKNFPVQFKITQGAGVFANDSASATVRTKSSGEAEITWKLGANPGAQQVTATSAGLQGSPVVFNATAENFTSVQENVAALPTAFALLPNSPNPFSPTGRGTSGNPETTIHFALPEAAEVTLEVFDANGRRVRDLMNAALHAGAYRVQWNGRNANGRALDSGVYFCRMLAVGKISGKRFSATRKLVLTK